MTGPKSELTSFPKLSLITERSSTGLLILLFIAGASLRSKTSKLLLSDPSKGIFLIPSNEFSSEFASFPMKECDEIPFLPGM